MDKNILQSICIAPSTTVKEAMQKLNETAQKILFVIDQDQHLLGTVSDGDIRRGIINGSPFNGSIEAIMCKKFTVLDHKNLELKKQAKALMLEYKINHIPLVDERSRILDVILWTDILSNGEDVKTKTFHDNPVVIMAGGKGTRLDIFTNIFPKPLLPIGDRPAIEFIMERFYEYGFSKFIYTLNYKKEYVKLFLKEKAFPYDIDWVEENEFLGTAGSLALLREKLKDTFFVVNCDSILKVDFEEILRLHKEQGAALTVVGSHNEINVPFGVLSISNGKLDQICERPVHDMIINTGMYVMEPRVLLRLTPGVAMDMDALINKVAENERVNVYPVYGRDWIDVGQWEEYRKGIKYLQN